LLTKVMAMPEVKSCTYVSKADALEELRKYFRNNPAILSGLMANPLPNSLEVRLNDVEQAASFAARLAGWPGVDQILYATVDYGGLLALLEGLTPLGSDGSLPASTADRCSTTLPGRSTRTWSFLRARPPGPNFA
jgi:cell division protein FtsX